MKVILLEDVKGTGKRGDVIEAKDGYVNNFLLPKKLALPANKQNVNSLEKEKERILKVKDDVLKAAQKLAGEIGEKEITLHVKAGESGKLFGAVTNKEIAAAIEETHGINIDRKKIVIAEPFKHIGTHEAHIKLHPDVEAKINVILKLIGEE